MQSFLNGEMKCEYCKRGQGFARNVTYVYPFCKTYALYFARAAGYNKIKKGV